MGWLGKLVGGAVGFGFGGPVGAVVGAGIGGVADAARGRGSAVEQPDFEVSTSYEEDDEGGRWTFRLRSAVPRDAVAVVTYLRDSGEAIPGRSPFCNADGEFMVVAPIHKRVCRAYLPFGAARYGSPHGVQLYLLLFSPRYDRPVACESYDPDLPIQIPWRRVAFVRPLVELGMAVANADGRLAPEEVRLLKRYFIQSFDLGEKSRRVLQKVMKRAHECTLEDTVEEIRFRFPNLPPFDVLELLAAVAHSDGEVDPREVKVIRRAAKLLGVPQALWPEHAAALGLDQVAKNSSKERGTRAKRSRKKPRQSREHELLGLSPGASLREVKAAYRQVIVQYHPDKVARMAPEFRDLAHEKTKEINAAFEALKAKLQ